MRGELDQLYRQRAEAYVVLNHQLLARYCELFRNYAWTDPQSAVDLMAAEIITLRRLENDASCWQTVEKEYAQLQPFAEKYRIVIGYSGMEHVVEDCIAVMRSIESEVARLTTGLEWTTAEKHSAQADAEREKNRADTLALEVARLTGELTEAQSKTTRLDAAIVRVRERIASAVMGTGGLKWDWRDEIAALDAARKQEPPRA
jgi:hypothetical protein